MSDTATLNAKHPILENFFEKVNGCLMKLKENEATFLEAVDRDAIRFAFEGGIGVSGYLFNTSFDCPLESLK